MKKSICVFAAILSFAVLFTSCKETKKEEVKEDVKIESHEGHDHDSEEMASTAVYQCPMDCEKGKVYENEGACPVCKMDLKKKVSEESNSDEEVQDEVKAADSNSAEVASKSMECTKCEPGKCECKA